MIIGLGLLTGNSAEGIVAMLMLVIGLPQTLQLVRVDWVQRLTPYLPSNAATFVAAGAAGPYSPGPRCWCSSPGRPNSSAAMLECSSAAIQECLGGGRTFLIWSTVS